MNAFVEEHSISWIAVDPDASHAAGELVVAVPDYFILRIRQLIDQNPLFSHRRNERILRLVRVVEHNADRSALVLGFIGAIAMVTSFVRFESRRPPKYRHRLGAPLMAMAGIRAVQIVSAPPTNGETIDETTSPPLLVPPRFAA